MKTNVKLVEIILKVSIDTNLAFCTNISDPPYVIDSLDLVDRLTKLILNIASQDTLIFMGILNILQTKKVRNNAKN